MNRMTGAAVLMMGFLILSAGARAATNWYVDNTASGAGNGTSWNNAWTSFSQVVWGAGGVMPGDTLYISGGASSKTYHDGLLIQFPYSMPRVTGTAENPVSIKVGQETGHNGTAVITNDGARAMDGKYYGIYVQSEDYVIIDGSVGGERRLKIADGLDDGVMVSTSHHFALSFAEIAHNGDAAGDDGIELNNMNDSVLCAEVSHCAIHDNYQDQIHSGGERILMYGRILIHDNEIYNLNDDGVECGWGVDFYNNDVHGLVTNGGTGHPDGIQTGGSWCRIHDNYFHDFYNPDKVFNAAILASFFNDQNAPESHFEIYNNLVVQNQPGDASTLIRGLEFTRSTLVDRIATDISDVLIANNTFIGLPIHGLGIFLSELDGRHCLAHRITVVNNIIHNCGRYGRGSTAFMVATDAATPPTFGSWGEAKDIVIDNNIVSAGLEGVIDVTQNGVSYSSNAAWSSAVGVQKNINGNPDPVLNSDGSLQAASPARDAGVDLSAYFTVDKIGAARPQGSAWDIGAYEYCPSGNCGGTLPTPTPTPAAPKAPARPRGLRVRP